MPKAPSCETPQASRGWVWGGVIPLLSRLGGLGERRKLSQQGPGRSPGNLRIFYVSSSILCLKFKLISQFYINCGTDKSIALISNPIIGSKSHNAYNTYKILSLTFKSLINTTNLPLFLIFYTIQLIRSTSSSAVDTLQRPSNPSRLEISDRSVYFQAPVLWNALSHGSRNLRSLSLASSSQSNSLLSFSSSRFHKQLKSHLFLLSLHFFPPQPI